MQISEQNHSLLSLGLAAIIIVLLAGAKPLPALTTEIGSDTDSDGFSDRMEEFLNSSPTDAANTPEHSIFPSSCTDGNDNDHDGLADSNDPGCSVQFVPNEILVGFEPNTPRDFIEDTITSLGTEVIEFFEFVDIYWLSITSSDSIAVIMEKLLALSEVAFVQPNVIGEFLDHLKEPNDSNYRQQQWSLSNHGDQRMPSVIDADIDAPQAWEHLVDCRALDVLTGPRVVVAVLDSGVDATHPDLAPAVVAQVVMPTVRGGLMDNMGHGTFVAGIIGAHGNNANTGGGTTGICWESAIYSVKVGDTLANPPTAATVAAGINHVIGVAGAPGGHRIRIINMSLGFLGVWPALRQAVARANNAGMLVVTAAGNDGQLMTRGDRVVFPIDPCNIPLPNVICVASSTESDTICDNSGRGSPVVKLAAPGNGIVGLAATGNPLGLTLLEKTEGRVGRFPNCGTSWAAPHTSGAAAHCWALLEEANLGPTVASITARLREGVDPRPGITANRTETAPNVEWGLNNDGRLRMCMGDDFGDAPDPLVMAPGRYPTLLASNGARHEDIGEEWFGNGPPFRSDLGNRNGMEVSPEFDADKTKPLDIDDIPNLINNDFYDDGIIIVGPIFPTPGAPGLGIVFFQVCTENAQVVDAEGGRYTGMSSPPRGQPPRVLVNDKAIYVNGFFDWNRDGDWDDELEYAFSRRFVPPPPVPGASGTALCHGFRAQPFTAPALLPSGQIWARFRLDYGEDVQHRGAGNTPVFEVDHAGPPAPRYDASPALNRSRGQAQFGEVEDWLLCDFHRDGKVDRNDINEIFAARGTGVMLGNPLDVDNDGAITVNDARICTLRCTNAMCAP